MDSSMIFLSVESPAKYMYLFHSIGELAFTSNTGNEIADSGDTDGYEADRGEFESSVGRFLRESRYRRRSEDRSRLVGSLSERRRSTDLAVDSLHEVIRIVEETATGDTTSGGEHFCEECYDIGEDSEEEEEAGDTLVIWPVFAIASMTAALGLFIFRRHLRR